jgi:hypothetical protein
VARANMKGVPKDELVLAEALANAEAEGLKFAQGTFGLSERGRPHPEGVVCVMGAYTLGVRTKNRFSLFTRLTGLDDYRTYLGNDRARETGWDCAAEDNGETLGYAFRVAMTEIK